MRAAGKRSRSPLAAAAARVDEADDEATRRLHAACAREHLAAVVADERASWQRRKDMLDADQRRRPPTAVTHAETLAWRRAASEEYGAAADALQERACIFSGRASRDIGLPEIFEARELKRALGALPNRAVFCCCDADLRLAEDLMADVAGVLAPVPLSVPGIGALTWQQRLYVGILGFRRRQPATAEMGMSAHSVRMLSVSKQAVYQRATRPAGVLPAYQIVDCATGSGKTVMVLLATLLLLTHGWPTVREGAAARLAELKSHVASGLAMGTDAAALVLCRAAVVLAPPCMVAHWLEQARLVARAVADVHGPLVDVRAVQGRELFALDGAPDAPTLWVLPVCCASIEQLQRFGGCAYAVRVVDEFNLSINRRILREQATPLHTLCASATTEDLSTVLASTIHSEHPMYAAVGGSFTPLHVLLHRLLRDHECNQRQLTGEFERHVRLALLRVPDFARRAVARGAFARMPASVQLRVVRLGFHMLNERCFGMDAPAATLEQFVHRVMSGDEEATEVLRAALPPLSTPLPLAVLVTALARLRAEGALSTVPPHARLMDQPATRRAVVRWTRMLPYGFTRDAADARADEHALPCCTRVVPTTVVRCPACAAPAAADVAQPGCFGALLDEFERGSRRAPREVVQALLAAFVAEHPTARVLLCYELRDEADSFCQQLQQALRVVQPRAAVCTLASELSGASATALAAFRSEAHDAPIVLVLSTTLNSGTIAGLDLYMTELTLICGRAPDSTVVQAMGRSLRMRPVSERFPAGALVPPTTIVRVLFD